MTAAPALLVLVPVAPAAPPPVLWAGDGTPEVNGVSLALDAPEKATTPEVPDGVAVVLDGLRTWSITWTTPPAIRTSGVMTLAPLTKTAPLMIRTVSSLPWSVLTVVLLRDVEYNGLEPLMTWYSRVETRVSFEAFARTEAMLEKAELFGAKMVTSLRPLTAPKRPVALRAPYAAVSFALTRVSETLVGTVRSLLMTWIVPPVKAMSAWVTVEFWRRPVMMETLPWAKTASTT